MQKPDADGYVNITWPSKTIPHGGLFHTRVAEPTVAQQAFLKVLLEESKLTIAQRRKSAFKLRQEDEKPESSENIEGPRMPQIRPRTSRRRSLSAIRESGIYELDSYQPLKRGEDREKLKERLANTMAYGDQPEQTPPPPPRLAKPKPKLPTAKEQWNNLLTQIRERAEWLAEMEDLGQAEPHREIVQDQIAERLRALEALGIDSECSSFRSGFSTLRSREEQPTKRSNGGTPKSVSSTNSKKFQEKPNTKLSSVRSHTKAGKNIEENVSSYGGQFTPLQYSPRRRV